MDLEKIKKTLLDPIVLKSIKENIKGDNDGVEFLTYLNEYGKVYSGNPIDTEKLVPQDQETIMELVKPVILGDDIVKVLLRDNYFRKEYGTAINKLELILDAYITKKENVDIFPDTGLVSLTQWQMSFSEQLIQNYAKDLKKDLTLPVVKQTKTELLSMLVYTDYFQLNELKNINKNGLFVKGFVDYGNKNFAHILVVEQNVPRISNMDKLKFASLVGSFGNKRKFSDEKIAKEVGSYYNREYGLLDLEQKTIFFGSETI